MTHDDKPIVVSGGGGRGGSPVPVGHVGPTIMISAGGGGVKGRPGVREEARVDAVAQSVDYVNKHLVGKVIASAELHENDRWPGRTMRIRFNDGTSVQIESEYDEGWCFGPDVPGRTE